MNIDRVAQAMTDASGPRGWRGPSGPAFTARVMAPIEGRPSPGFTARVMNGLDAPRVAQGFSPAFSRALILVPAALVLAAGAVVLLRGSVRAPALPSAPVLATNGGPRVLPVPDVSPAPATVVRSSGPQQVTEPAVSPAPPIYMIAALEGPPDIAVKNIEPAARTIPALDAPAPLKVSDLPAGGGSQKEIKE